jgi:hypothetical protein
MAVTSKTLPVIRRSWMAMQPSNAVAGIMDMAESANKTFCALTGGVAAATGAFIKGKGTHASSHNCPVTVFALRSFVMVG